MADGPLAHLRVVDLTDVRGALAGRLLADLGADVVLATPPDAAERRRPPCGPDGTSLAWLYRHANKRGAPCDVATSAGRARLDALLADADVLVENLAPAAREAADLAPAAVRARHPALVHVVLADFGLDGPRAGWRLEALPAFAASGTLFHAGFPDRPPCWLPGHAAHDAASAWGCIGALAALTSRVGDGAGQTVEVSVQEAALTGLTPWSIPLEDYARIYPMMMAAPPRNADGNYLVLPCADGFVRVLPATPRHWRAFVELLGRPEALAGPEWDYLFFRVGNGDVIRLVAGEALATRTRAEVVATGRTLGVPIGPVNSPDDFVAEPQTVARGYFRRTGWPGLGDAPVAVAPGGMATLRRPAPVADAPVGWGPRPSEAGAPVPDPPFAGLRVVSFGVVAVGPEVGQVLSELGADVVKVESRTKMDPLREVGIDPDNPNRAFTFNDENRGHRSVALDLSTPRGRDLALALCAQADVVIENNRGGVARAWGLDWDDVRRVRPDVVYLASQGYGRGGPLGEMPAFGPLNAGFAGAHLLWNHADVPYPAGASLNHPDHVASRLATVAVLAALAHRRRTGAGRLIDLAQTEAAAFLLGEFYLQGPCTGVPAAPAGNAVPWAAPHGVYPVAGDDRWLALAVVGDAAWDAFRAVAGLDDVPAWRTTAGRVADRAALDARVAAWTAARDGEAAAALLQAAGVSAMPVLGPDELRADAHLAARHAIVTLTHPEIGPARHAANPLRPGRMRLRTAAAAPCLGADTADVLAEWLGLDADAVAALAEAGVCR